jgi:rubrerythrin
LQVIEERAVKEYPVIADVMRPYDAASAAVVDQVARDEVRHVKYARAISRKYAPDDATLERTLALYRAAEARAFEEQGRAVLAFALERDLLGASGVERFFWRALAGTTAAHS